MRSHFDLEVGGGGWGGENLKEARKIANWEASFKPGDPQDDRLRLIR